MNNIEYIHSCFCMIHDSQVFANNEINDITSVKTQ